MARRGHSLTSVAGCRYRGPRSSSSGFYSSVDDVDLFVGIFSERPNSDAMVGPTALCIIGDQSPV